MLRAELIEAEALRRQPSDPEAWDYAAQGTAKIHRPTLGAHVYTEAKALFDRAIALDPELALAWEGLSFVYFVASTRELPGISGPDTARLALEAAEKAVSLDPRSSNAHVVLGLATRWVGLSGRAIAACETALALNPNNDEAYLCASRAYYVDGRQEDAIRMVEIAGRLNPQMRPWRRNFYLGASRYFLGEYEAAAALFRAARTEFPRHQSLTFHLAAAEAMAGNLDQARQTLAEYYELPGAAGMTIDGVRRSHADAVPDMDLLAEGLRRAGMPER